MFLVLATVAVMTTISLLVRGQLRQQRMSAPNLARANQG